jgi:autotransporter-associated beta strand protein
VDNAFPTGTTITFNTATGAYKGPAPIDLNGHNQTIAGLSVGTGGGTLASIIRNDLSGTTSVLTVNATGSTTYSGQLNDGAGKLALTKAGSGTLVLSGDTTTYSGGTTVKGGALILQSADPQDAVQNSGIPTDIQGGRIIFNYAATGDNPNNSLIPSLQAGYASNFSTGQIRSSTADTHKGLGYADDTGSSLFTIAYTYYGDLNLDGQVTSADFDALAMHFNQQTGGTWPLGDVNYDGRINALDFNALATNYGATPLGVTGSGALVPEPTFSSLLCALSMLVRRNRRISK